MSAVLTDVDTVEVSLVDRGANMKRFALRKQRKTNMSKSTMTKAERTKLAKLLAGKTVAQLNKALADVSPEGRKALMSAIGILANAQAQLPEGLLQEIMTAAGIESPADMIDLIAGDSAADEADDDMPSEDGDIEGEPVADSVTKPTTTPGENMPTQPAVPQQKQDEMYKSQIAKAQKDADDAKAQLAKLEKQAKADAEKREELEKKFKASESARLEKEFIAKAAKLSHVVGVVKAEDLGPVLKAFNDTAPEQAAKLEKFFEQLNEKLSKTDELLKELGKSNAQEAPSTAMEALEKAAADLMKSDAKLTKAVAFKKALDANPKLYEAYNEEKAQSAA